MVPGIHSPKVVIDGPDVQFQSRAGPRTPPSSSGAPDERASILMTLPLESIIPHMRDRTRRCEATICTWLICARRSIKLDNMTGGWPIPSPDIGPRYGEFSVDSKCRCRNGRVFSSEKLAKTAGKIMETGGLILSLWWTTDSGMATAFRPWAWIWLKRLSAMQEGIP